MHFAHFLPHFQFVGGDGRTEGDEMWPNSPGKVATRAVSKMAPGGVDKVVLAGKLIRCVDKLISMMWGMSNILFGIHN